MEHELALFGIFSLFELSEKIAIIVSWGGAFMKDIVLYRVF